MRELVTELALGLREHVLPFLGAHTGRAHVNAGAGGDVTFAIDSEAEQFLERFLAERAPEVAFYSEDRGLVRPRTKTGDLQADRPVAEGR
jgi:fructose-1,6-bisphosphatase/inositol monophosphatase family enzyme